MTTAITKQFYDAEGTRYDLQITVIESKILAHFTLYRDDDDHSTFYGASIIPRRSGVNMSTLAYFEMVNPTVRSQNMDTCHLQFPKVGKLFFGIEVPLFSTNPKQCHLREIQGVIGLVWKVSTNGSRIAIIDGDAAANRNMLDDMRDSCCLVVNDKWDKCFETDAEQRRLDCNMELDMDEADASDGVGTSGEEEPSVAFPVTLEMERVANILWRQGSHVITLFGILSAMSVKRYVLYGAQKLRFNGLPAAALRKLCTTKHFVEEVPELAEIKSPSYVYMQFRHESCFLQPCTLQFNTVDSSLELEDHRYRTGFPPQLMMACPLYVDTPGLSSDEDSDDCELAVAAIYTGFESCEL